MNHEKVDIRPAHESTEQGIETHTTSDVVLNFVGNGRGGACRGGDGIGSGVARFA